MQLLPSRGGVSFPHSLNLGWLCDLLWPIEYSSSFAVWHLVLCHKRPCSFCFHPLGRLLPHKKKCLTILLGERGPMEKERPWRVKYYKGRWEAQPAHSCFSHHSWGIRYERAHILGPSAPAKLSEATPHGIEISHSQQVLLKLQNHEQTNGGCFKPLSFWVVCFTTDSWTRKIKWDSSTPPSGWQV